jgi:hypothetical protein
MREMVKEMDKYKLDICALQTLRSVILTTGKKGKKTELTGKGPLRRRRSAMDCSATEEEKKMCSVLVTQDLVYNRHRDVLGKISIKFKIVKINFKEHAIFSPTKCTQLFSDILYFFPVNPTRFDPLWKHRQGLMSK